MLSRIRGRLGGSFAKNLAITASGQTAVHAVNALFAFAVARIYGPVAYGVLGTYMAVVAIAAPVAALSYPTAIVLIGNDRDASALANASLRIGAMLALACATILTGIAIVAGDSEGGVWRYLPLVAVSMFFSAWLQAEQHLLMRNSQFKQLATAGLIHALAIGALQVGLGLVAPLPGFLVLISALTYGMHATLLCRSYGKGTHWVRRGLAPVISLRERSLLRRHSEYPIYRAPQLLLNGSSVGLPVIFLTSFFGAAAAGHYSLARMALALPSLVIGKAVGDVLYPRLAATANKGSPLNPLVRRATFGLGLLGLIPYSAILVLSPWLFPTVFGSEWAFSGKYAQWLSLWLYLMFLNGPSVRALLVLKAQRFHLLFSLGTLVARILVLFVSYKITGDSVAAVAAFSVSGAAVNALLILIVDRKVKNYDRRQHAG